MDLYCKTVHLWGQKVDVGGNHIDVPLGGVVRGLDEETAARLLQDSTGWQRHVDTSAAKVIAKVEPVKAAATPMPAEPEALTAMKEAQKNEPVTGRRPVRRSGEEK